MLGAQLPASALASSEAKVAGIGLLASNPAAGGPSGGGAGMTSSNGSVIEHLGGNQRATVFPQIRHRSPSAVPRSSQTMTGRGSRLPWPKAGPRTRGGSTAACGAAGRPGLRTWE